MIAMIVATLIALFIVSGLFTKLLGQSAKGVGNQINQADDTDGDGVINLQDKCPCKNINVGDDGCPQNPTQEDKNDKTCFQQR